MGGGSSEAWWGVLPQRRELVKSKLWARSWTGLFSNSLRWEQGWKKAREGSPGSLDWDWKLGSSLGQEVSYREVSLVDP